MRIQIYTGYTYVCSKYLYFIDTDYVWKYNLFVIAVYTRRRFPYIYTDYDISTAMTGWSNEKKSTRLQ